MKTGTTEDASIQEQRKKYEYLHGMGTTDPTIIRNKEYQLLRRGVALPDIPKNDPAAYCARLDQLLEDSKDRALENLGFDVPPQNVPYQPSAGSKTVAAIFQRSCGMTGLTTELADPGEEESWQN